MAYTLADLRTLVRQRADMEGSAFVSDTEITRYINDAVKELFELLVVTYGQEYFYSLATSSTTSGDSTYAMPSDAFKLLRVDVLTAEGYEPLRPWKFPTTLLGATGSTRRRPGRLPLYRWSGDNIIFEPEPTAAHTYRVHYVPRPVRLVLTTDTLGRPYDDWVEFVILGAAIKCLQKEESDASPLDAARSMLRAHISTTAPPKDIGYPQTVVDERGRWDDGGDDDGGWTAAIAAAAVQDVVHLVKLRSTSQGQVIPDATSTLIQLDTIEISKGTAVSAPTLTAGVGNDTITVNEAGYYLLTYEMRWAAAAATSLSVEPFVNGVSPGAPAILGHGGSAASIQSFAKAVVLKLNAGDAITLKALQVSGGNRTLLGATLAVHKLTRDLAKIRTAPVQSIPTGGVPTVVTLSATDFPAVGTALSDSTGSHAIAVNTSGLYLCIAEISISGASTPAVEILKNGASIPLPGTWQDELTTDVAEGKPILLSLEAGDMIGLRATQNSGVAITLQATLALIKVRAAAKIKTSGSQTIPTGAAFTTVALALVDIASNTSALSAVAGTNKITVNTSDAYLLLYEFYASGAANYIIEPTVETLPFAPPAAWEGALPLQDRADGKPLYFALAAGSDIGMRAKHDSGGGTSLNATLTMVALD